MYVEKTEEFTEALKHIGETFVDNINVSIMFERMVRIISDFDMETQEQLLMLQKTILYMEGLVSQLNPEFNVWTVITPYIETWARRNIGLSGAIYHAKNRTIRVIFDLLKN
jgi:ubiquinone biosynthesis protein